MAQTIVLGSPVRCSDTSGGLSFLRPRVSGVVLNEEATGIDYLIVHRGLIGGHDQVVPADDIAESDEQEVALTISLEELKELPELESQVPGQSYTQRSVSAQAVVLGKGTPVTDAAGQVLGNFYGVVAAPSHRLEQVLLDSPDHAAIPAERVSTWSEEGLQVGGDASPEAPQRSPAPASAAGARDPVCGAEVYPDSAIMSEHRGQQYAFCSIACKQTFERNPEAFAVQA